MLKAALKALTPAPILRVHRARSVTRHYAETERSSDLSTAVALCQPGCVAIDIGANLGVFTHALRRKARTVHAFEANPEMVRHLNAAFSLTPGVRIHPIALSDHAGTAELRVPLFNGKRMMGLATIAGENSLSGMRAEAVAVPMATLDSLRIMEPGFIKIDVEGHELAVLRGARETIARWRPDMLIEAAERHRPGAAASVIEFMAELGYRGWFLLGDELVPVDRFDVCKHQRYDGRDDLGRPVGGVISTSNFVFSARGISARLTAQSPPTDARIIFSLATA